MRKLSMDELGRKTVTQFHEAEKTPVIVVLDNIRSMHNVGSIFRSADAFLIEAIYLCGYTPQPPHRDIHKTALGATDTVSWTYFPKTEDAVTVLTQRGYAIYAVEQAETSLSAESLPEIEEQKIALIFGNEVSGVDPALLPNCRGIIEIPQAGMKHSLNVSVAAGIVLWECFKLFQPSIKGTQIIRNENH